MNVEETAQKLINAKNVSESREILAVASGIDEIEIAYAIKNICYDSWTNEPTAAQKAARALRILAETTTNQEVENVARWIGAISKITEGKLEDSLVDFRLAYKGFLEIGKTHEAAQTQNAKMIPLGLLGDYERAVEVGQQALETFESLNDEIAAAKIETNLAVIAARQGKHRESMEYCVAARDRFAALGETQWLLMAENDLAIALAELNEFGEAEERYQYALRIAQDEEMHLTEAEILASLGNLQTFRGQYGEALRSLELSRKKFVELEMRHRSVIADLEIAEIYQILNLTDEAKEIYEVVNADLGNLGMQGEEARARLNYGRLALTNGDQEKATAELEKAAALFMREKNPAGAASVRLVQSKLMCARGSFKDALELIGDASSLIEHAEFPRLEIETAYFRGEILRQMGRDAEASDIISATIDRAEAAEQLNVVTSGYVALAKIEISNDNLDKAEKNLARAIDYVEKLRDPIPAEEFRMSFLADKLAPYTLSSRVSLSRNAIEKAFVFAERARSRTLQESMNSYPVPHTGKSEENDEYGQLREQLNWRYSSQSRRNADDPVLADEIVKIEKRLAEIVRIDSSVLEMSGQITTDIDWSALPENLRNQIGNDKVLIEYTQDGLDISAFVLCDNGIDHFEAITTIDEITKAIEGLRFQFETMRFDSIQDFEQLLKERANAFLEELFRLLLAPFGDRIESKDLVIVPVGPLFYVPFNALFDGRRYLIESNKVSLTPSALIWSELIKSKRECTGSALVLGYADDKSPLIDNEAASVGKAFEVSDVFTDQEATLKNYFSHAGEAETIHLACHGEFRADSPLYSNLRFADGFLTVRDIASQRLNAGLVTLSACETGLNKVYAGEEILGLARGFLGAGASNIVMSLWTVNDEATGDLMDCFYNSLSSGQSAVEALQSSQKQRAEAGLHPYYWAPFVIIGG